VARTQALNQMRGLVSTAPEPIRDELRRLNVLRLLERAANYRPGAKRNVVSITKFTLRLLTTTRVRPIDSGTRHSYAIFTRDLLILYRNPLPCHRPAGPLDLCRNATGPGRS
jgi:hypothetical protein